MDPEIDAATVFLVIIGVIVGIITLVALILKIDEFRGELWFLNREIRRSEGEERQYWKRKRRRLWLSLLPFYRR